MPHSEETKTDSARSALGKRLGASWASMLRDVVIVVLSILIAFAQAAALADFATEASLEEGTIYPPLRQIREVSISIATRVAELAYASGVARAPRLDDLERQVRAQVYSVEYD